VHYLTKLNINNTLQFLSTVYTHFKTLPLFFNTSHTNPRIAQKMHHISCKTKHCIHYITNTSQKQSSSNTFAIILIPVNVCVLHREWCVVWWNWKLSNAAFKSSWDVRYYDAGCVQVTLVGTRWRFNFTT